FSVGPGLGPCLRTVATAARALAIAYHVPLIAVNHCIAHVEIGRYATGSRDPVVLYASGANTQVIGYLKGRYRIFGETLDIGLGNALDKFARGKGLPHPGGPVVEDLAKGGRYIELPYTVKGMDLAFSGLVSAAKDSCAPIEDVCCGLQETSFAMCVEVTERALAYSGKEEVLLVGGVGANKRLQEMLAQMSNDRNAHFFVPETRFLGDNGAMIAYTGKLMLEYGCETPIASSQINPSFRSDQVTVTWRDVDEPRISVKKPQFQTRGAEAVVSLENETVIKRRVPKPYRVAQLDRRLIAERTRTEAKAIANARRAGVPTPVIKDITKDTIVMENVSGIVLSEQLEPGLLREAGRMVGKLHSSGIVHGDLTTGNLIVRDGQIVVIDFGLSQVTSEIEPRGVDIHVLFQTLESTTDEYPALRQAFAEGYCDTFSGAREVLSREQEILGRARYL
ncbi:MAG: bifunctional N(6)-L-threonylcarbamoyladenine synthase/serine/threonine protein kinase, partial [Methanoregulaceae archaeon]|nr:bifunctional N(6)-L-threonylcarbamoyladenine synthase/serine/threonine protein kinase [Methanoregulaceae archaeon]